LAVVREFCEKRLSLLLKRGLFYFDYLIFFYDFTAKRSLHHEGLKGAQSFLFLREKCQRLVFLSRNSFFTLIFQGFSS